MSHSFRRLRRSLAILTLILAGALTIIAAPIGILAERDDALRIDQFQPITISEQTLLDLEAIAEDLDPMTMILLYIELQDFGEFETDLSEDMLREAASLEDVNAHLDGEFRMPGYLPEGIAADDATFKVGDAGSASYTFDVAKAHRISELLDLPTNWLPDASEHSHLKVSLDVPRSALAKWTTGDHKLVVGQVGSPELQVPSELDLDALRQAILDDPRMPDELGDQLAAIDDWERTLPVPVPEDAEYRDVQVDGEAGFVLTMDDGSAIVWEADGTLFFVVGTVDGDEVERVARSMSGDVD